MPKISTLITLWVLVTSIAGCADLPTSGPITSDVIENSDMQSSAYIDYVLIDVTEKVLRILATNATNSFQGTFGTGGPPPDRRVAIGDSLAITIWEAGSQGLFSNAIPITQVAPSARGVSLPELVVTQDGEITIPFAGRIPVAGALPAEVERAIASMLQGKAVEPQVIVTIARSIANTVSVGGEVVAGARVPLSVKGDRVLDAIAAAGGVRAPINEAVIRLTRGDTTISVPFWIVVQNPEENIYLEPSDVLTVIRLPQTFTTFGALGRNFQIPFEMDYISAEEAIAKAGGFLDQRADPGGLFVFRFEPVNLARELAPGRQLQDTAGAVPVVYRLDMRQAGAYFLAREFTLRNKDIVYVANAPLNELQKFLNLVGSAVAPFANAANTRFWLTR
jgi:polysaccharide export outer membrane protein